MKKYSTILAAAAVCGALAAVSCNKENENNGAALTVCASQDDGSKVYLSGVKTFKWMKDDAIIGFNTDGDKFVSNKNADNNLVVDGTFKFENWTGEPSYFLYSCSTTNTVYNGAEMSDTSIVAIVPSTQRYVDDPKTAAVCRYAVVTAGKAVATAEQNTYSAEMKNTLGYLKLTLGSCTDVASIEISSAEHVNLAGKVSINAASIDAGAPVIYAVEGEKTITLVPSNGANANKNNDAAKPCFNLGTYYVAMIPGAFTPVITFTDTLGNVCTRTASKKIAVGRGEYVAMTNVDANLDFEAPSANIVLRPIADSVWMFKEELNATQTNGSSSYHGETYTLTCGSKDYEFQICKHYSKDQGQYTFSKDNGLCFSAAGSVITLPQIPKYRLASVKIKCNKGVKLGKTFGFVNDTEDKENQLAAIPSNVNDGYTVSCAFETLTDQNYYLYFYTSTNIKVYDLEITYVPGIAIGFNNDLKTIASKSPFSGVPTASTSATNEAFTYGTYTFTPMFGSTYYWNQTSNMHGLVNKTAKATLKLPKIAGYKLHYVKFGTKQTADKEVAIYSAASDIASIADATLEKKVTINNSKADIELTDAYDSSKDYYYYAAASSTGLRALLLIYTPVSE